MTHDACIRLRNLTKVFGSGAAATHAVAGLDLDIGAGEIVALLGPNGAGKTTTLDMILGFTEPTTGTVSVFGTSPADAVRSGKVSAVLQTGGLLRDLRVRETVELIASTYTAPPAVDSVLEKAGITSIAGNKVQACSGGEQQRLRFALALLADPALLVLDEPTAGMDVRARQDFWAAMRAESERGRTVVFATHYLQEAEDFAERTVLIADGRVVADGPTDQVRRRAAGRTVSARFPLDTIATAATVIAQHGAAGHVAQHEDRLIIESADSDSIARLVLGELAGFDLEIAPASLEQAFLALTTGHEAAAVDAELAGSAA